MKQFLLPQTWSEDQVLTGEDFHYLINVRRLSVGRKVRCRTQDGANLLAEIVSVDENSLLLRSLETGPVPRRQSEKEPFPKLHLLQGVPKGKKFDLIVRQATELGVTSITPLVCKHSVPEIGENWTTKKQRFTAISREAFQQSGADTMPEINEPLFFGPAIRNMLKDSGALGLFLHELELEQSTVHGYLRAVPDDVFLVVGPEGGLAEEEVEQLREAGFLPWFLGKQVLRTETAAVVGLGTLRVLLREHEFWSVSDRIAP